MVGGLFDFNISLNQIDLNLELIWFRAWQKVVSVFTRICSEIEDREEIVGVEEYFCQVWKLNQKICVFVENDMQGVPKWGLGRTWIILWSRKDDHWLWHWPKHKITILFHFYIWKLLRFMIILWHVDGKQFFCASWVKKMAILCFN